MCIKKIYFTSFLFFFGCMIYAQANIYDLARKGTAEETQLLISEQPNMVNTKSKEGFSPLLLAVYHENEAVVHLLIKNGAVVDENSTMGSPLMAAVVKNNETLVKLLLSKGANVDAEDANGTTALIYAVNFQLKPIVELLLSHNPKTEHKDNKGFSALDYAEKLDNQEILQLLRR